MKRLFLTFVLMMLVYVPVASAISNEIDVIGLMNSVGVRLIDQGGQITVNEGQTLNGTIEEVDFLTKQGMKGLMKGDAVAVTYMGNKKYKFVHVPSGQQIIRKQGTDFPANFLK